jgi:predicted enzyme related to lactoylglutathione lyase
VSGRDSQASKDGFAVAMCRYDDRVALLFVKAGAYTRYFVTTDEATVKRVTGIGGIFFKAKDPKSLGEWYREHLGVPVESWGGATFSWSSSENPTGIGTTIWTPFKEDTSHFAPSKSSFMINFRVHDLHALVKALREEGCVVDEKVDESEYGKFGWVMDPEGNRVELWEPPQGQ